MGQKTPEAGSAAGAEWPAEELWAQILQELSVGSGCAAR